MVEFVIETVNLILKLDDLSFTLDQLGLFTFEVISLLINQLVHVIDSGQLLRDVVLKSSGLSGKVTTFLFLDTVVVVELVNFFSILHVPFPQAMELIFKMCLLRAQLSIQVIVLGVVTPQPGDFCVTRVQNVFLGVQLGVEVRILFLSIDEQGLLIINILSTR